MLNVIFLDIDGVLVTGDSIEKTDRHTFDKDCVEQLNRILSTKDNIGIVITSTWRIGKSLEDMNGIFKKQGIDAPLMGMTPRGRAIREGDIKVYPTRGEEIYTWLVTSFSAEEILQTKAIVIDDEQSDMGIMKDSLFKTEFKNGLTKEVTDDIISALR